LKQHNVGPDAMSLVRALCRL